MRLKTTNDETVDIDVDDNKACFEVVIVVVVVNDVYLHLALPLHDCDGDGDVDDDDDDVDVVLHLALPLHRAKVAAPGKLEVGVHRRHPKLLKVRIRIALKNVGKGAWLTQRQQQQNKK